MKKANRTELSDADKSGRIFEFVKQLTLVAMNEASDDNQVDALSVGVAAVAGALHGVAAICGQREGIDSDSSIEDQKSTVNDTSALIGALLVAKATHQDEDCLTVQLNPVIYLAVVKAAETILGRNVDDQLNPCMVGAARRWENENGYVGSWQDQTVNDPHGNRLN